MIPYCPGAPMSCQSAPDGNNWLNHMILPSVVVSHMIMQAIRPVIIEDCKPDFW
ncbi:unnamed protein product, partial [Staurois parvus]